MELDFDQVRQNYIVEARENLDALEEVLLELENDLQNQELLNSTFRIIHTIKGSGAMFGFDAIVSLTHEVESTFDKVRSGKLASSERLIELTLKARDVISNLLLDENIKDLSVHPVAVALKNSFIAFARENEETDSIEIESKKAAREIKKKLTYRLFFKPDKNLFRTGNNPAYLLEELGDLGDCAITLHIDKIPPLPELNPEDCYLDWEVLITTTKDIHDIQDIFIFVEDQAEITVEIIDQVEPEERIPAKKRLSSSIRVDSEKLDHQMNLVGQLLTIQGRLTQLALKRGDLDLTTISEEVERLTADLRNSTMSVRVLPISTTFNRFKRLVRDLGRELGVEARLETIGGETELDKTVIEQLNDPLIHLIRNAMDHGIEKPRQRKELNKPEEGTITLSASYSGSDVLIKISDDGHGIHVESVRQKAIERGLIKGTEELSDREVYNLMCEPGFSMKNEVSSVSGRGVGMDVVKQKIADLRGSLEISSEYLKGSVFTLRLPLTLAIIDGLLVKIGATHFVIPVNIIEECVELKGIEKSKFNKKESIDLRGVLTPCINLRELFDIKGEAPTIEQIIVTRINLHTVGFVVDTVVGEHQTVIKPLGKVYKDVKSIMGATIIGNGKIALILDTPGIYQYILDNKAL